MVTADGAGDTLMFEGFATMEYLMARPRSEAARQKVLDAALELIAVSGVASFTVDAVSARSGVAKTTIYRHWDSGNALLIETMKCAIAPMPTPNTGALRTDLTQLVKSAMEMLSQPALLGTMLEIMARVQSDPELQALHAALEHERVMPLKTVLLLAQARGEISPDADLELMVDMVGGPVMSRRLFKAIEFSNEEIEELVDLILGGIIIS